MKKVTQKTSKQELEDIKKGDIIQDSTGKGGEVEDVDKLSYNNGEHYYYKIKHDGTILIVK